MKALLLLPLAFTACGAAALILAGRERRRRQRRTERLRIPHLFI